MPDGCDQELYIAVVDAGEGIPEVDGYAVGQACRDLQHPLLASGTGKARAQRGDRGGPVDDGRRLSAADSGVDGDEPAGEVGPVQPGLGDEQLGGGFETAQALSVGTQPGGERGGRGHSVSLAGAAVR